MSPAMGPTGPSADKPSREDTDTLGDIQAAIRHALYDEGRSLLLALDLDGTLADYAAAPHQVTVPERLHSSLNRLLRDAPRTAVVIVSGRSVEDLLRILGPAWRSHVVGNHGLEVPDEPLDWAPPAAWRPAIERWARTWPGLWLEDKGATWAVHYRAVSNRAGVERALADALKSLQDHPEYHARQGHLVVDIVPRHVNKGTGLARWAARHLGPHWRERFIVSLGDDTTDRDLLQVAKGHGLAIQVGQRPGLDPDQTLPGPEAARELMHWISGELDRLDGDAPRPDRGCSQ